MKKAKILEIKKNERGITLVALVVTIVVLLILAGITISTLFGDNGIINAARKAADETTNSQSGVDEKLQNLANKLNEALVNEPENIEEWEYELDETTDTITITKYKGKDTEVVIPNIIDGHRVKSVGCIDEFNDAGNCYSIWDSSICSSNNCAYGYPQETITKVTISEGIEELKTCCFGNTQKLTEVVIPNTITSIGYNAFNNCKSLNNVTIPNSVANMESSFRQISSTAQIKCDFMVKPDGWKDGWTDCTNIVWLKRVEPKNIEDWEYRVDSTTNTISILNYKGKDTEVVIPNYIGGVKVKQIGVRGMRNYME